MTTSTPAIPRWFRDSILDDGQTTISVATDVDVHLGEEITVHGRIRDGTLDADDVL